VIVDLLGRLDTPVPQAVPYVVQRVILLNIHHPVSDTVAECVGCHVVRLTTVLSTRYGLTPASPATFEFAFRRPWVVIRSLDREGNNAGESFHLLFRYDDNSRVTSEASSNVAGAGSLSFG